MSGKGRAAKAKKRSYDYYSDYDDEDFEEYMAPAPAASSSSTSGKKRAVRGKAKKHEDPKEVASVQRILARASRMDLERLLLSHIAHGQTITPKDLVSELPDCLDVMIRSEDVVPYSEANANLGQANFITRDLLRNITAYLPLRSRLVLCDRVCKTWSEWLREEGVVFFEMNISMNKYWGDKHWLDGDKVVKLFERSPPGSIQRLSLIAHDKSELHKKHLTRIYKLHDRFSNLRSLDIGGERYANDIMKNIAIGCTAKLTTLVIRETKGVDVSSINNILSKAPCLLHLTVPSLGDNHTLGLMCDALEAARGGAPPFLREFKENSSYSWRMTEKPVSSCFRLFLRLPNLESLTMSVRVPRTVDLYRQSMGGALDNAVFPQVKKLSLTISAGGFGYAFGGNLNAEHSDAVNAFFADLARHMPNVEELEIRNKRPYLSQKDKKSGAVPSPNPVLSGSLSFPKLTKLTLSGFDCWAYQNPVFRGGRPFPPFAASSSSVLSSALRANLLSAASNSGGGGGSAGGAAAGGEGEPEPPAIIPFALDAPMLTKLSLSPWVFGKLIGANEEERARVPQLKEMLRLAPLAEVHEGYGSAYCW